jgi:Domain of unknown function (DUF5134)
MSVPVWLLGIFAAVMLLVATVSAARLALARRADRDADIDVSHLLMGIAMAGTLVASLSTLPALAWEIVFAALTVWFACRVTREYQAGRGLRALVSEHHAPHLLHSAAMLYMFLALRPATGQSTSAMAGMSAGGQSLRLPTLALLFAFLLCAYVVADLNRVPAPRLSPAAPAPALTLATTAAPAPGTPLASRTTLASGTSLAPGTPLASAAPLAPPAPIAPALTGLLSPAVARGCRIAMGVTMAFMLIIMI